MSKAKRVLIVEPHGEGHRGTYLKWIIQGAIDRGWAYTIATTQDVAAHSVAAPLFTEAEVQLIKGLPDVSQPPRNKMSILYRELGYWCAFRRAAAEVYARARIDLVILPYLDYCFHVSAFFGSPFQRIPWSCISMRLRGPDGDTPLLRPPWKWRLAVRLLQNTTLRKLLVINPSIQSVPAVWCPERAREKLEYLPDPADEFPHFEREAARAKFNIDPAALVLLVFGSIDQRKGVAFLLSCLRQKADLSDVVVVIAGKQSEDLRAWLATQEVMSLRAARSLIVLDYFLSEADQSILFLAADVVWVGYEGHQFMSGVLVLAGKAGLPVIACKEGEIGWMTRNYNLGISVDIRQGSEIHEAIKRMFDADVRNMFGAKGRQTFKNHTPLQFCEHLFSSASGDGPRADV